MEVMQYNRKQLKDDNMNNTNAVTRGVTVTSAFLTLVSFFGTVK